MDYTDWLVIKAIAVFVLSIIYGFIDARRPISEASYMESEQARSADD